MPPVSGRGLKHRLQRLPAQGAGTAQLHHDLQARLAAGECQQRGQFGRPRLDALGVAPQQLANAINLLSVASDVDATDTLSVVGVPATLPPGITHVHVDAYSSPTGYYGALVYHPAVDALIIDPTDPSFQSLAEGEQQVIAVEYGVSDGTATTPATAVFTVVGTNDAPVVSGAVTAAAPLTPAKPAVITQPIKERVIHVSEEQAREQGFRVR